MSRTWPEVHRPIDGHDVEVESALRRAKASVVRSSCTALTARARHQPARDDEADQFHAVGVINAETGCRTRCRHSWTDVFADEMVKVGNDRPDVVAIPPRCCTRSGCTKFAKQYPDRIFDVGIAEQHAATSAAGWLRRLHPVVAVYATSSTAASTRS